MSVWSPTPDHRGESLHAYVVQVANGQQHGLLLTDEGIVYSWGAKNDKGQLGRTGPERTPSPVTDTIRDEIIVQIACGHQHCLVLSQSGALFSWGFNKAGQVGVELLKASSTAKDMEIKRPMLVKGFSGKDPARLARSISCGPESSACITTEGEVYVWGVASYYLFNLGKGYGRGENFTMPVRVRGITDICKPLCRGDSVHVPGQIALFKNQFSCTICQKKLQDNLKDVINSLKLRANQLATIIKAGKSDDSRGAAPKGDDADEPEELKALSWDLRTRKQDVDEQIEKVKREQNRVMQELARIGRELTICDQQDTALEEFTSNLEVEKSKIQGQRANGNTSITSRGLDTQLNDIDYFKDSNKRSKLHFYEQRDALGKQKLKLQEELDQAMQARLQVEGQEKLIHSLRRGDFGGRAESGGDDGLQLAVSKCQELADTEPMSLAGNGRWTGFGEVLAISERALSDVSSALKEVSAASNSGDGVLESVLELNLKLRKECVEQVKQKMEMAEKGRSLSKGKAFTGGKDESFKGMVGFFQEVSRTSSGASRQQWRRRENSESQAASANSGMFALPSPEGLFGSIMGSSG